MVRSKSLRSGTSSSIARIVRSGVWSGASVLTGWLAASRMRSASSCGFTGFFSKALRLRGIGTLLKLSTENGENGETSPFSPPKARGNYSAQLHVIVKHKDTEAQRHRESR